jgi:hypothetical protein
VPARYPVWSPTRREIFYNHNILAINEVTPGNNRADSAAILPRLTISLTPVDATEFPDNGQYA